MMDLFKSRASGVFLLLITATVVSWQVGHTHLLQDRRDVGILIVLIAFIKVRWVMMDFMELRHGPRYLRVTAHVWLLVVCSVMITLLLRTAPLVGGSSP